MRAVERAAAVEGVEAHRRPAAEPHVAARGHVGRVGGEHAVELDGDVGLQRLRRRDRAAQIEFLLHRKHEMHGRPRARPCFSARATSSSTAQPARSSTAVPAMRPSASSTALRLVDDRRADIDAGGERFVGDCEAGSM